MTLAGQATTFEDPHRAYVPWENPLSMTCIDVTTQPVGRNLRHRRSVGIYVIMADLPVGSPELLELIERARAGIMMCFRTAPRPNIAVRTYDCTTNGNFYFHGPWHKACMRDRELLII